MVTPPPPWSRRLATVRRSTPALGGRVVPQRVKVSVDTDLLPHLRVPVRHAVRVVRHVPIGPVREQQRVVARLRLQLKRHGLVPLPVLVQYLDRRGSRETRRI